MADDVLRRPLLVNTGRGSSSNLAAAAAADAAAEAEEEQARQPQQQQHTRHSGMGLPPDAQTIPSPTKEAALLAAAAPLLRTRNRSPASGARPEKVALFDLDLTLLDVNTGRLWVEKEFRDGKVPLQMYLLAVYWFARYAAGLGLDAGSVSREAMGLYGGHSDEAMGREVESFWARECAARARPGALAALQAHRAKGDRCVLCTASWQHVAAAARRSFGLDGAICSVIEVGPDGRFTGGVADAYGESKLSRTLEWARAEGVDLADVTFYTDSHSDLRLLEAVGTPVAVCPDARLAETARRRGWRVEDWGRAPPPPQQPRAARYGCSVFGVQCL